VVDNFAVGNGRSGIQAGDVGANTAGNSTVTGNTADRNGVGIECGAFSTVTNNTATSNIGLGLRLGSEVGYGGNVVSSNNMGNANPQVSGGIQIGTNLCGTDTTCP
jgi:hypothetical protein